MSVKSLSGSLKAGFSLTFCLDCMQSMFIYLQMNPNEEPFRLCDVQKISGETEAPHIQILSYLVSVVAPLIPEMNFSHLTPQSSCWLSNNFPAPANALLETLS